MIYYHISYQDGAWSVANFKCCLPNGCSDATTNIITVHIFSKLYLIVLVHTVICYWSTIGHVEIIDFSVVNITVVPHQYRLQCVQSVIERHFRWYYVYNNAIRVLVLNSIVQHKSWSVQNIL